MMGYIYILTFPNGKKYVGQTLHLEKRYSRHRRVIESIVSKAIRKYGWESIEKYVYECELEDMDYLETELIKILDSIKNGYNLDSGGHKNKIMSDDTKRKISKSLSGNNNILFGKHLSEETKRKLSESQRGAKSAWYGKHHSEETLNKLRNRNLSESTKEKIRRSKVGEKAYNFGKHLSEEHRQKISRGVLAELKFRQGGIV